MENEKRRIGVIIGSVNDLTQCVKGLDYLRDLYNKGALEVPFVNIISAHRNRSKLIEFLTWLSTTNAVDVLVVGAGWAAILPGVIEAFLRYEMKDKNIHVYGVAFEDPEVLAHTQAAIFSIVCLPGLKVYYDSYSGPEGFYRACRDAADNVLPPIDLPKPKEPLDFTLGAALAKAHALIEAQKKEG